ncbi:hypothetical protein DTL42_20835 [Bremerella cremea]|uniref:Uncharacterized protein n=1 Tax=Bremerella cremea TaxID=1031537 RepID=A0A368KJV5_9BACT|nr:hypothetical protein [Bremerella cremea]RCS41039.1 hypothetical protein DTL42_20835 [Bremerella cremea]
MTNPFSDVDSPESHNPFQSPAAESLETIEWEPPEPLTLPSWRLVVGCILVVSMILGIVWFSFLDFQIPTLMVDRLKLTFVISLLIVAVTAGMGISLLVQSVRHREFSRLMPGHWRLIAFSTTLVGQILFAVVNLVVDINERDGFAYLLFYLPEAILACAFYCWVLGTTRETTWWKRYAGICIIYYLSIGAEAVARWLLYQQILRSLWNPFNGFEVSYVVAGFVAVIAIVMAMLADDRRKTKRDAYHAVGLVMPPFALFATWILYGMLVV